MHMWPCNKYIHGLFYIATALLNYKLQSSNLDFYEVFRVTTSLIFINKFGFQTRLLIKYTFSGTSLCDHLS